MKTLQPILSGGASLGKDHRGGSRGRSPHRCTVLVVLMFVATLARGATNDLSGLLQKGLFEEEANRNLDAASAAYQTLVTQFDKDRQIGATAIFRLGEVYRKQGKTNEAAAQYERIVRDFAEQTTLVTLSRQNLAGLGVNHKDMSRLTAPVLPGAGGTVPEAELLKRLKNLSQDERRELLPLLVKDPMLDELIKSHSEDAINNIRTLQQSLGDDHPAIQKMKKQYNLADEQIDQRISAILKAMEIRVASAEALVATTKASNEGKSPVTATFADEEEAEIRRIQAMIRNSPDLINAPSGEVGLTPLHTAARQGQLTVARFLIDNGANANSKNSSAQTPLIMAASAGHKAMAELLLSRGADVNARTYGGATSLHIAASSGFGGVAEGLLAHKANVSAVDNGDRPPLHLAASSGHSALMELLIRNGADANAVDNGGQTALMNASQSGHSLAVNVLLSAKADVNAADKNGVTSLIAASGRGHLVSVKALLAAKAAPDVVDQKGRTALSYAAGNGHLDVVKALLDGKADPNAGSLDLPLAMAVQGKRLEVAECLLKAGADPNERSNCSKDVSSPESPGFIGSGRFGSGNRVEFGPFLPLQIAVSQRDASMVALLLKFKADTNVEAPWAPNRSLAGYVLSDPDMLKSFLTAGVDVGATNWESWPLLLLACANANPAAVEMLLAHGANPNTQSRDGHWALELAVKFKCVKCVELLLKAKADVNARDDVGATPLYWAVDASDKATVELLLAQGANPNIAGQNGETPLSRCKSGRTLSDVQTKAIAPLLREHGALDELPDFTRIRITRQGLGQPYAVFGKVKSVTNQYTLLETVMKFYSGPAYDPTTGQSHAAYQKLPFPDFGRIIIRRPNPKNAGADQEIKANLLNGRGGVDCANDMEVQFGDVIEIPEQVHALDAKAESPVEQVSRLFTEGQQAAINMKRMTAEGLTREHPSMVKAANKKTDVDAVACLRKTIHLMVAGNTTLLTVDSWSSGFLNQVIARSEARAALRSSSELTRVQVKRKDAKSGKVMVLTVDATDANNSLWLQDGDVIEVPDKP